MCIADHLKSIMAKPSLIREMFEKGAQFKALHGDSNVFDFSLGHPSLAPPEAFGREPVRLTASAEPGRHGYMPKAGFAETRRAVADIPDPGVCQRTGLDAACPAGGHQRQCGRR